MTSIALNTASCLLALVLIGLAPNANADSFMMNWLARQQSQLVKQVSSQTSSFNGDAWLAHQKGKPQEDWLTRQVASQVEKSDSFSEEAWLSRQEASSSDGQDGTFNQASWAPAASWEADEDLEQSLLADVEEALGKEHRHFMENRITAIEDSMKPMFKAMPKNEYDKLGHSSARYMLHRFFVEQHGWSIDGLFAEGAPLNASSPSHMLKDRVPMFVEGLFEKRLAGKGFDIHEMSVLVAVVEDSIHQESQSRLKNTYKALGLATNMSFDRQQLELIIELYMSGFVMDTNMSNVSANYLYDQHASMLMYYPTWTNAQSFFREVTSKHITGQQAFPFAVTAAIVSELVDTFGTFHGSQCQGLKTQLQDLEGKGKTGCVNLPAFYEKGLKADSNWLFIESPQYLRQVGVLDETDVKNPRLLTANYINGPSNCLQPTGYYMVCCHNQCDDILGNLEKVLAQPSATPAEITSALKTSSLRAGSRLLEPTLRRRLQEVADHHGGRVPIHGRLFAQWLHHAYPHECPYPHKSGTKRPQWVMDFEEETGLSSQLSDGEMQSFVRNASKVDMIQSLSSSKSNKTVIADAGSCAPWQDEEELFAPLPLPASLAHLELENDPHLSNMASAIAFLGAVSTFFIAMMRTCKSLTKVTHQSKMLHI